MSLDDRLDDIHVPVELEQPVLAFAICIADHRLEHRLGLKHGIGRQRPDRFRRALPIGLRAFDADIGKGGVQTVPVDLGARVVEDQPRQAERHDRRERHRQHAAERGADRDDPADIGESKQAGDVVEIDPGPVVAPVRVVVRATPAAQIRAQHPPFFGENSRDGVEVAGVPEEPAEAEYRRCGRARIAVVPEIEAETVLGGKSALAIRHRRSGRASTDAGKPPVTWQQPGLEV